MQNLSRGSGHFADRHELDRLPPTSAIAVSLASDRELSDLIAIAKQEIPQVDASDGSIAQVLRDDPESAFSLRRVGSLLGGIAFLYLNYRGHDALLLDGIDLRNPSREFLAQPGEEVSAIYVWGLVGHGRAVAGLGNVAEYLRRPRFVGADYFAQPSTRAGRNLLIAIGFESMPSFQRDLWRYQRPWHRTPRIMPASYIQARSFPDARH
jgi:hypothetical protein